MNSLETLLNERWILKSNDKNTYYKVKDDIEKHRKFIIEKFGLRLIINPILIKMEKIPYHGESYMGIKEFDSTLEYVFLCQLLIFLEDKDVSEQFVLSELTEFIETNIVKEKIDWTVYRNRRKLIKVLKFAVKNHLIYVNDGTEESFQSDISGEVLYENTGASKYFMRNFTNDISSYKKISDFEGSEWVDVDDLKGQVRRNRVYKKLLFSPGLFRGKDVEEDFDYLKNFRNRIEEDFKEHFDIRLDLHRSSAYLILSEYARFGKSFPKNNMVSDIILIFSNLIYTMQKKGELKSDVNEIIELTHTQYASIITMLREQYISGFNKEYREMNFIEFKNKLTYELENIGFIEVSETIKIFPIVAKIVGDYSKNFLSGVNNES